MKRSWEWISVLRQVAFAVSVVLAFVLAEKPPSGSSEGERALEVVHRVTVRLITETGSAPRDATLQVFRENTLPEGDVAYPLVLTRSLAGRSAHTLELAPGTYRVLVHASGSARLLDRWKVEGPGEVDLRLLPAHALSVKVLVEHEGELQPLPGATVLVGERNVSPHGAQTDALGEARFAQLPPGPARVVVFARGYENYEAVTEGDLVIQLRPTSILRVHVERQGQPRAGAEVFVAGIQLWPTRRVLTGPDGYVDLSGLSPGSYSLYASQDQWVSSVERDVMIRDEAGRDDVTLRLREGRMARVRVVAGDDDRPVADAKLSWGARELGQFVQHGETDAQGELELGPFLDDAASLRVRAPGYVATNVDLELDSDPPQGVHVVALEPAGKITGRVVDDRGFPIAGASVEVVGVGPAGEPIAITFRSESVSDAHFDWARQTQNVLIPAGELGVLLGPVPPIPLGLPLEPRGAHFTTDDKGRFVIVDVPPGDLVVLARHPSYVDGKSSVVHLQTGKQQRVEVTLTRGEPLRGRVVDHRDFPVRSARITATGSRFSNRTSTEEDGSFELMAAPGAVTVRVSDPMNPLRILVAKKVIQAERRDAVEIALPAPREDAEIQVLDERDEPVELAQVKLVSTDERTPLSMTRFSGAAGVVTLTQASGLPVQLSIEATGYVPFREVRRLKENDTVRLRSAVRVEGRVLGVRGRFPAAGARVTLKAGNVTRQALVDAEGSYRINGVPPGNGTLSAAHDEYGKASRAVRIAKSVGGRNVELPDLELSPTLRISGRVLDDRGRFVAGAVLGSDRISAYLSRGGSGEVLGRSDERGRFVVEVESQASLYLYAADPARSFGFSDALTREGRDQISDVGITLDHRDEIDPSAMATVLVSLEERAGRLIVYAVADLSRAARDGVRVEDEVLRIDDEKVPSLALARELLSGIVGTEVRLTVRRGGTTMHIVTTREAFLR